FALSVAVVFAAVLLGRTLMNFVHLDPGFRVEGVLSAPFDTTASGYPRERLPALADRLVTAPRSGPGGVSASGPACGLLDNCSHSSSVVLEGSQKPLSAQENWIGPAYFATTGIPLVAGREFERRDLASGARVAIITQSLARQAFPGQNPV